MSLDFSASSWPCSRLGGEQDVEAAHFDEVDAVYVQRQMEIPIGWTRRRA